MMSKQKTWINTIRLIMLARDSFFFVPFFLKINAKSGTFIHITKSYKYNFSFQLSFRTCNVKILKFQLKEDSFNLLFNYQSIKLLSFIIVI